VTSRQLAPPRGHTAKTSGIQPWAAVDRMEGIQNPWARALCAQTGPDDETWFPLEGGSVRDAKRICRRCPLSRKEDGGTG